MAIKDVKEIREIFFDEYDGFADKRLKNLTLNRPFIVDDRGHGDFDAKGQLFLWFCSLFIEVETTDKLILTIRGDMPMGPEVTKWLKDNNFHQENAGIEITLTPKNIDTLIDLIKAIETIIQRRYFVKSYKYVVPRTAESLSRLYKVLKRVWI